MSGNFLRFGHTWVFGIVGDTGIRDCEWRSTEQDTNDWYFSSPVAAGVSLGSALFLRGSRTLGVRFFGFFDLCFSFWFIVFERHHDT